VIDGAVRLHADLGQLVEPWRRSPRQALARLHVVAAHRLVDDPDALGRPRLDDTYDNPLGLSPAPDPREVAQRIDTLSQVVLATRVPAVVVAAVVHGELLALRPFGVVDGLVARAASRLVIIDRGLDPKAVSAPEVGHAELHHDYEHAAEGFLTGGRAGIAAWLVHCCEAFALGAREGKAVCEVLRRESA
jgi:hypothetical protein